VAPETTVTPAADRFVSMKVRSRLHRWLKARAAERGMSMYALLERWLGMLHGRKPWEPLTPAGDPTRCRACGRLLGEPPC
jgi:hypothetical protein